MSGRIEGSEVSSYSPATGGELGRVKLASTEDYERTVTRAAEVFERWRMCPAPQRGEIVREIGEELRKANKAGW